MGQIEVHSGVLLVKPEVKRRLGRPRRRWRDNIKNGTPRKENESAWIGLIWHMIKTSGGLLWVPVNAENFMNCGGTVSSSGKSLLHGVS
jgi:hypothetical protein